MVTRLGTPLGTQLGTEIGAFPDNPPPLPPPPFDATKHYALSDFSAANYYDSQPGGGEVGDAATGFGVVYLLQATGIPATTTQIVYNNTPASAPFAGHTLQGSSTGLLRGTAYRDTTNNTISPSRTIVSSDLGKFLTFGYAFDPGASRLRAYADRQEIGTATTMATYVPGTLSSRLGVYRDLTLPTTSFRVLGWVAYRGVLSSPNLLALFDSIRAAGDVPTSITGVTVTRRISLRDTLAVPNVAVSDGDAAPATLPDSVTLASVDAMTKAGSPLVRVIDPALNGRVSYGAIGFTSSSYLDSAPSAGIVGSTGGFYVAYRFDVPLTSAADVLVSRENVTGLAGYSVYIGTTSASFLVANGSAYVVATCPVPPGRRVLTVLCRYSGGTGGTARIAVDGVEGAPVVLSGSFSPLPAQPMRIGAKSPNATVPAATSTFFSVSGGDLPVSDAEAAAFWAQALPSATLPRIAGKTQHEYDITQDVVANGGPSAGIPATVQDRVGTDHLTRSGSNLVVSQRTERLWSYETTPIYQGADTLTNANHFVSTFDDVTAAGQSFWNAFLYWVPGVAQVAGVVAGASSLALPNTGWDLRFAANNTTASWFIGDGSAFNSSGNAVLLTGRLNLLVQVWDQISLRQRLYHNRAEVGTGAARTGYAPTGAGTKINLGCSPRDTGSAGGARTLLGFAQGLGQPSPGRIQALYDSVVATDAMQGIPGMTSVLVDVTADIVANGGTLPAALTNRAGAGSFTRVGTPTLSQIYARAYSW